jgi:hypothetical protein
MDKQRKKPNNLICSPIIPKQGVFQPIVLDYLFPLIPHNNKRNLFDVMGEFEF